MQCDICSEKESEMEPLIERKCFVCNECESIIYISLLEKNKNKPNNELNNFA